jgi:protein O-GlcNAc transferase
VPKITLKVTETLQQAFAAYQAGKLADAEKLCRRIISVKRDAFDALHILAVTQLNLGRKDEALTNFDRALALQPNNASVLYNRSLTLQELKRYDEALASYERTILAQPDNADALLNRGHVLRELNRHEEALASYDRVLKARPDYFDVHILRGNMLQELKRYEEALASYDRALRLQPNHAGVLNNRGNTLKWLMRYDEALLSYEQALKAQPDYADALNNRGTILQALKRHDEALADYDIMLTMRPDSAEALFNRGMVLMELKREVDALESYDRALKIMPDIKYAEGHRLGVKMLLCDWNHDDDDCAHLVSSVRAGRRAAPPFTLLAVPSSVGDHLKCAQIYSAETCSAQHEKLWHGERYAHERIRVAYVSADFREHAVARLLANMFENHDRSRFETIAISLAPNDQSEMQARLKGAFDRFIEVHGKNDQDIARLLRELEVDIAVDLMGFTAASRPAILSFRAAPIQVNYLSYPGLTGTGYIDYIVADRFVIPEEQRALFSESVVYLPDTYLAFDSTQKISAHAPTRAELGLPETGFVFCAYNNSYKIRPAIFDIWMRLLHEVEGGVLWLLRASDATASNLRREAAARGVDSGRLIFASYVPRIEDHLARYRVADLFLDTLPFNAQTTACDALWAGLPVVTRLGETFVGRVAASVLSAVGLPELITHSADEYEALALKLAREPGLLAEFKSKLARNRATYPLFDSERFTRHMEAAYTTMWERWQRGESPQGFSVEPHRGTTTLRYLKA